MAWVFKYTKDFNQDISNWDTSSVKNFNHLFEWANAFDQDISDWNISSAQSMDWMFENRKLISDTNKGKIHQSFASNPNWPYDWSDFVSDNDNNPATDGNSTSETGTENNSTDQGDPDSNGTTIVDSNTSTPVDSNGTGIIVDNNTSSPSDDNVSNPGTSPSPEYFRPFVRTGDAMTITANSATLSGTILDDGNSNISERGFLISTYPCPNLEIRTPKNS